MAMSKDRVRFILADSITDRTATAQAAVRAFGLTCGKAHDALRNEKTIICRPSQFARFLIYRSELVSCNRFRQFQAELIPAEPNDPIIDMSAQ